MELQYKKCSRCGIEKPITNFPIIRILGDGTRKRRNSCRGCTNYATGSNLKSEVRQLVLKESYHTCRYCNRPGTTIDHVIPLSRGGNNYYWNLVCACEECNTAKGDMTFVEYTKTLEMK